MEEITAKRIRCNLTDGDMKFFKPKHTKKYISRHTATVKDNDLKEAKAIKPKKEKKILSISQNLAIFVLVGSIILSGFAGVIIGDNIKKSQYLEMIHLQESIIRSEAIADYKAQLEEEEAEAAAEKMSMVKDEAMRRNEEVILFTKLFEGVRGWNFDILDLITYGVCVWNRAQSPMFDDTIDEVIHQKGQWINYSDDNAVVADYKKIAEKLVDLLYNSDVQLCSTKYCWIEIRDGHLYLKDSFNAYPGMILWRYQGET
jgi:hypothetical protein